MKPDRFVLDTNTILSGIVWPNSIPAQALSKALESEVIISVEVVEELKSACWNLDSAAAQSFVPKDQNIQQLIDRQSPTLLSPRLSDILPARHTCFYNSFTSFYT